jgi:membrane protein
VVTTTQSGSRERRSGERASSVRAEWRSLSELVGERGPRELIRDVIRLFMGNNLLTYASAIGFQAIFALISLSFTGLALLGFLSLSEVWTDEMAPEVADRTSAAAFTVIDETVQRVLSSQRGFWLTLGAALALWNVSSGVRAAMGALDDIYGARERRSFVERITVSLAISLPLSALFLGAVVAAQLSPQIARWLLPGTGFGLGARFLGWVLAVVLLTVAVWVILRFGPSVRQPSSLVSLASLFVVAFWLVASLAFGFYATYVASYGSVFGSLAFVFVLLVYLSISTIAFLAGVQADAYLRGIGPDDDPSPASRR